jgi:hypothetical protein
MLTPEQRLRQARVKWLIISRREIAEFEAGTRQIVGDFDRRMMLDALRVAYDAGRRAPEDSA